MFDKEWCLTLKNAFKELTDSDRRVIELIWKNPGFPVFHLPEKLGRQPGGMVGRLSWPTDTPACADSPRRPTTSPAPICCVEGRGAKITAQRRHSLFIRSPTPK
jgi:hypothetical protein